MSEEEMIDADLSDFRWLRKVQLPQLRRHLYLFKLASFVFFVALGSLIVSVASPWCYLIVIVAILCMPLRQYIILKLRQEIESIDQTSNSCIETLLSLKGQIIENRLKDNL